MNRPELNFQPLPTFPNPRLGSHVVGVTKHSLNQLTEYVEQLEEVAARAQELVNPEENHGQGQFQSNLTALEETINNLEDA